MNQFAPSRAYQARLDIRFADGQSPGWADPLVEGQPPNAQCWLVIMPRRGGKTWLASAIAAARPPGTARRVDLRQGPAQVKKAGLSCLRTGKTAPQHHGGVLLIDEPGLGPSGVDPGKLAAGLHLVHDVGTVTIVLATPQEFSLLIKHLGPDGFKDVLVPPALNQLEISRMADRAPDWGPGVVDRVRQADSSWLQTPFLLELVLHLAEERPELRMDPPALLRAAAEEAEDRHEYLTQLFRNGLAADQRAELRANRWRAAGIDINPALAAGQVAKTSIPGDPVLAHYLPDILRIHHISDLHCGGKLRRNVDDKDRSQAGEHLADLAGAGTPLDRYLAHVKQLAEQQQAPHLVIVTGDLVDRPHDPCGDEAIDWLKKLGPLLANHRDLRPEDPRIVLVGGNHDVSWDKCLDPNPQLRHSWFANAFGQYPHPDLHLPADGKRRLFVNYPEVGLRLALLGSAESGGEAARDEDRDRLIDLRRQLSEANQDELSDVIAEMERFDPGVVSRAILDRLVPEAGYLTLAALHHPLSAVPAVEVAPYSGIVNAGQTKAALADAQTALVLHGHTHLAFLAAERFLGQPQCWTMRIAGAATLASTASYEQNGYNQIFIAREGGDHLILVRPMRFDNGQWVRQPEIAFRPGTSDELPIRNLVNDSIGA
jgi:3',5'-cyclic AMP phosphodiesterase CpdA